MIDCHDREVLKEEYVWQHNFTGFAEAVLPLLSGLTGVMPSALIKLSAIAACGIPRGTNSGSG
jgi:hypothetical protein